MGISIPSAINSVNSCAFNVICCHYNYQLNGSIWGYFHAWCTCFFLKNNSPNIVNCLVIHILHVIENEIGLVYL